MPSFSTRSSMRLLTCHQDLKDLFCEVVKGYDCTILCGHRDKLNQDDAYYSGHSKLKYPESKHNKTPSMAVDVAPYPIAWHDRERFYHFAGYVKGIADKMGIKIRWGGDWDGDTNLKDQTFFDLPHFELIE